MSEFIRELKSNEVFVFGSNYAGRHGRGAALTAYRKFGARMGQGMGRMGRSYGIATKDEGLRVLSLEKIGVQVARFLRYAMSRPEERFLVTEIGCGLAGYSARQIGPLFTQHEVPRNVVLPESFVSHKS
jgi:hypothetical protein